MGKLAFVPISRRSLGHRLQRNLILLGERLRRFTDGQSRVGIWRVHRGVSPGHFLSLCTCDSGSTQLAGVDYTSGLFHGTRSLVSFVAIRSERLAFSRGLFFYVLMHSSFRRRLRKRPPETANHSYQSIRKKTRVCFCAHVRT